MRIEVKEIALIRAGVLVGGMLWGGVALAQPVISLVTANSDTIGRYEKFELDVDLVANYTNPFDPDDIDISAKLIAPDGAERWVWGFWDGRDWKVRFSPNRVGSWSYYVKVRDGTGVDSTRVALFLCQPSNHHGPLRVSPRNPRFLAHDDSTFFYGIGQCRPWWLHRILGIFNDMQSSGMNVLVYWMPSWDNMLVTQTTGYDRYHMARAAEIDWVVEQSEAHDIYLMFTIWNHDELRGTGHQWGRPNFDLYNPFNRLTNADGFFTDSTSWVYQTKLYRYIIARWAYSRAIGFWQTISEIDGTSNRWDNDKIRDPWHQKINNYFKSHDPFGHLTTASKSGDQWWPNGYSVMDVVQVHSYQGGYVDVAYWIAQWTKKMWDWYTKPNVVGEFGTSFLAYQTIHTHNGWWSALATGAAVTPLDWNDGGEYGDFDSTLYRHGRYFADFVSTMKLDELALHSSTIASSGNTRAWGMNGHQDGYFWIQDRSPGNMETGIVLTLSSLPEGRWEISWYDTWTGSWVRKDTVSTASGSVSTVVPAFVNDVAGKVRWLQPTSVDFPEPQDGPGSYYLSPAYPNPFNPTTTIEFSLPQPSLVTLRIYNTLGEEVATLVSEKLPAGSHQRVWEAKGLASGVYLYRLQASEFVQVKKLTLLQ